MEEINYAENGGWMRYITVNRFTQSIGNLSPWKEDEGFQIYPYSKGIVGGNEELSVLMFRKLPTGPICMILNYKKGVTLGFIYKYNSSKSCFSRKRFTFLKKILPTKASNSLINLPPMAKTALG